MPFRPMSCRGALVDSLPARGPEAGEPMERILEDFEKSILPHVTHWNHPGFMGYFATSGSGPGVLGDLLASALNPIGLLWKTCPALVGTRAGHATLAGPLAGAAGGLVRHDAGRGVDRDDPRRDCGS